MSTTRALLARLVDDAAIFPPGNAPLPEAVREHRGHRNAAYADFVGPLLLRTTDAPGAAGLLEPGEALPVAVIVRPGSDPQLLPTAVGQVQRDDRARVVGVELPVSDPLTLRPLAELDIPLWLEVSPFDLEADLDAVAAAGCHAKLRTGGLSPDDVPTDETLARFLVGAHERALRFKLTAGLHHAVRHTAPATAGIAETEQHGVANVLAATALATSGATVTEVSEVLAERDGKRLRRRLSGLSTADVARVRAAFASFGCCGVTDPITELTDLLP